MHTNDPTKPRGIETLSPREIVDAIDALIKLRLAQHPDSQRMDALERMRSEEIMLHGHVKGSPQYRDPTLSLRQVADGLLKWSSGDESEIIKRKITDGIIQYSGAQGVYQTGQ